MLKEKPSTMNKIGRWGRKAVMVATAAAVIGAGALSWTGGAAQAAPGDPVLAPTIKDYVNGGADSYVLMTNGDLYGFGKGFAGSTAPYFSPLGQGTVTASTPDVTVPIKILSGVKEYVGSSYYNFALMNNGTVMYWGLPLSGTPYASSSASINVPTKIESSVSFEKILSNGAKIEPTVILQDAEGYLYGLGMNSGGSIGEKTKTSFIVPTRLPESQPGGVLDPAKTEIITSSVSTNISLFFTKDKDTAGAYHLYYKGGSLYGTTSTRIDATDTMIDIKQNSLMPSDLRTAIANGNIARMVTESVNGVSMILTKDGNLYASGHQAILDKNNANTFVPMNLFRSGVKSLIQVGMYTLTNGDTYLFGNQAYYTGTNTNPTVRTGSYDFRKFILPSGMTTVFGSVSNIAVTNGKSLQIFGDGQNGRLGDGNSAAHFSDFKEIAVTKSYLQAEYDKAATYGNLRKATKSSLTPYQQRINTANTVLQTDQAAATQTAINTAAESLYAARQALVLAPKDGVYTKLGTQLTYYTPDQFNSMSLLKKSKLIDKLAAGSGTLTLIDGNQYANLADLKAQRLAKNAMKDYTAGLVDDTKYMPAQ